MKRPSTRRLGTAAAAAAVGALYLLAARAVPVGAAEDDALHILLARALSRGAFALRGVPANDPLPGFAALLCLPAALVEPRWALLKIVGLLSAAAAIYLTWRLARRFLDEKEALAAAALTALSPLMLLHAGLILPDLPYLALSLFLFERLTEPGFAGASAPAIAAAAAAAMLRPYGAWLVLSLALAIAASKGARKASFFMIPALTPLALWTLRNRLLTGAGSGYLLNMNAETAALAEPRTALLHAAGLLAALGGDGLLSLGHVLPLAGLVAAGAAAAALAAAGAVRLLRKKEDPRAFALAAYAILLAAQHLVWLPLEPRYALPLVPLAWILMLAAAAPHLKGRRVLAAVLFAALAAPALRLDLALAAPGLSGPARFQPATMAWLRENTPENARVESLEQRTVSLLSGRDAELPDPGAGERDAWLADALSQRFEFVHVVSTFAPGGFFPAPIRRLSEKMEPWARSTPYLREVFRSEAEGTAVFRVEHPAPDRYLNAWSLFADAVAGLRRGGPREGARAKLDRAVALEPRLALAWAWRGLIADDPREKRRDLDRAAALDPTSDWIRRERDGGGPAREHPLSSLLRSNP